MPGLGIHVQFREGRPTLRAVLADDSIEAPTASPLTEAISGSRAEPLALQLATIVDGLVANLGRSQVEHCVIRVRDFNRQARMDDASWSRAAAEGALLLALHKRGIAVEHLSGREIGLVLATDKATADSRAADLVGSIYMEAGAAALAALARSLP